MKNYIQAGDTLTLIAPYAVAAGSGCKSGSLFAVAVTAIAQNAAGPFTRLGVVRLPKNTAVSSGMAQGAKVYWDDTNRCVTNTATSNLLIGVATVVCLDADLICELVLSGAHT